MNRIQRMGALPMLAAALITVSTAFADASPAGADGVFADLVPAHDLGAITGMAGVSSRAISDNLIQVSTATIKSTLSDVALGNADTVRSSSSSTATFSTGGVQGLSFAALGGANAIAINTGIASGQTQSVNVNLVIGSAAGTTGLSTRGR